MILLSGITGSAIVLIFVLFFVLGIIPFVVIQIIIQAQFKVFITQLKQNNTRYVLFQLGIFALALAITFLFLATSYWLTGKGLLE